MAQSLSKILIHTVFSTKERRPLLRDEAVRADVHPYLGGILGQLGCEPIMVGGVEDHVHLLSTLPRTRCIADIVKEVKRGSAVWLKQKDGLSDFAWQNGYGVFSIGFSQIAEVRDYIANQAEHHRRFSFQDEFRRFMERYQVTCDERYLWD